MKVEPGIIFKLFLSFRNFEPQYCYRLYSYKKSLYNFFCIEEISFPDFLKDLHIYLFVSMQLIA